MHWFSILFVGVAALTAVFSAHAAWRLRRDISNWAIDSDSGTLCFQSWPEFSLAALSSAAGCGVIMLALGL